VTRKLVIFNDHSWSASQYRSKHRPVFGNATLAERCLLPHAKHGTRQISLLQNDHQENWSLLKLINQTFGTGIRDEITEAYHFLAHHYMPGDEIYLIGAGRGGHSLQCLAEMISISGLLQVESLNNLNKAYIYSHLAGAARRGPAGQSLRKSFKSRKVPIRFLGCWDSVGGGGVPTRGLRSLSALWSEYLSENVSTNVQSAYQALALDEMNPSRTPNIWTGVKSEIFKRLEQVWFAGTHENITGGQRDSRLSDVAFRWLINKASEEGLEFDPDKIDDLSTPDSMGCVAETTKLDNLTQKLGIKSQFRKVGKADTHLSRNQIPGTEKVHYSVIEKALKDTSYSPKAYDILPPGAIGIALDRDAIHKSNRKFDRVQVNCPATLLVNQSRYNGNVIDFCEGGARIWMHLEIEVGTPITLRSSVLMDEAHDGHIVWAKDQSVGVSFQQELDLSQIHIPEGYAMQ